MARNMQFNRRGRSAVLERYFKDFFWTFHLGVIAGAALLLASTVNAFVAQALHVRPERLATEVRPNAGPDRGAAETGACLVALLDRNLFRAAREDLKPQPPTEASQEEAVAASFDPDLCEPASMSANLLGTIVAGDPETSVAIFQDMSAQQTLVLRMDDRILDQATIRSIQQREVRVDQGGRCALFSLDEQKPSQPQFASAPPPPMPVTGGGEAELGLGIKQVNASEYEIPRGEIDSILGNLNTLATHARIVPSFHNGQANGFKLFSIRPNSLYAKIGIQNGDVIQRINGFEMNSPDKALEIYTKLKDASSISVDLLRRGKSQSLNYNVR